MAENTVVLQYLGKSKDLKLKMPWLSRQITFRDDKGREAEVPALDAARLVRENPATFMVVGGSLAADFQTEEEILEPEAEEAVPESEEEAVAEKPKPKKKQKK